MVMRESGASICRVKNLSLREPSVSDTNALYSLVKNSVSPPHDSRAVCLFLCKHLTRTCVVAEEGSRLIGFLAATQAGHTLSVVQIAVDENSSIREIGMAMILQLLLRDTCKHITFVETSVSGSDSATQELLKELASKLKTDCSETTVNEDKPSPEGPDKEMILWRVGPVRHAHA